ncbi:MAG: hypothetical protein VX527_04830 [Planctomycetota bacterium]|nr:hypothetical protein [Planctomycetota bacterium]
MAKRSSRPALYELSQSQLDRGQPTPKQAIELGPEPHSTTTWLTPGAGIRVPGGFLLLGVVVLVACVVIAWWLGYRQGVSRTEILMAASPNGLPVDPLQQQRERQMPPLASMPVKPEAEAQPLLNGQRPWHFVLAETNQAGAERLAAFCRAQGLEVLVVPRHNTELARIIALPGMATSSRQTAEVRAQEAQIAALGRQWKQNGGRTDFSDRYVDRIVAVIE